MPSDKGYLDFILEHFLFPCSCFNVTQNWSLNRFNNEIIQPKFPQCCIRSKYSGDFKFLGLTKNHF